MDLREVDGKLPFDVQDGLPQQVKSVNEDSGELSELGSRGTAKARAKSCDLLFFLSFFSFLIFETGFLYIVLTVLELTGLELIKILLPLPPKCCTIMASL